MTSSTPLLVLATSILTADGSYTLRSISIEEARDAVSNAMSIESFVGHQSTADLMTRLLGVKINANRGSASQLIGQDALIWRLDVRLAEGRVLTDDELIGLPASWKLLTRIAG